MTTEHKITEHHKFSGALGTTPQAVKESILYHLTFSLAHDLPTATKRDWWLATSKAMQDRIIERMIATHGRA